MKTLLASTTVLLAAVSFAFAAPKVGEPAPGFTLTDTNGKQHSLADFKGKHVVLEWINHGCPFVQKHYNSQNMQTLQKEATEKGAVWLSICSSAPGKQGHMSAEEWNKTQSQKGAAPTAVLLDTDGKVGRAYEAKTTPHMYIIDPEGKLVYAGAIDDKSTANAADAKTANNYVRVALGESMAGKAVSTPTSKPYGCSVKY